MGYDSLRDCLSISVLFGLVFGVMLIAYDEGEQFALFKKLRCKLGWHKIKNKIGKLRINTYYCTYCKKPRKHPALKVVEGGKKIGYK